MEDIFHRKRGATPQDQPQQPQNISLVFCSLCWTESNIQYLFSKQTWAFSLPISGIERKSYHFSALRHPTTSSASAEGV